MTFVVASSADRDLPLSYDHTISGQNGGAGLVPDELLDSDVLGAIAPQSTDAEKRPRAQGCIEPFMVARLTGTALISIDCAVSKDSYYKDISLGLVFGSDRAQIGISPVDITATTGVRAVSDGGMGDFCCSSGLMEIPLQVRAGKNGITLNLDFTLSTEVGEARGPFTPGGARLQADGSVTLAGAASDSVFGIGVNVLLVVSGIVHPLP